jgi:outer membrane protein TolC
VEQVAPSGAREVEVGRVIARVDLAGHLRPRDAESISWYAHAVPRRFLRLASGAAVSIAAAFVPIALAHAQAKAAPSAPAKGAAASASSAKPIASASTAAASSSAAASASASSAAPADSTATEEPAAPAATSAPVETTPPQTPAANVYGLTRCLALADANSAQIRQSQDRLEQARAQADEATWAPWSQFNLSGGITVLPVEIRGNSIYSSTYSSSTNISFGGSAGIAWRIGVDGVVPLWTFGKISSIKRAAEGAVGVAEIDVERQKILVHHDVRRAYFAVMLAHDARYLLDQAGTKLEDALKKAEARDDVEEVDLLRMKTYRAEIKARMGDVEKGERMGTAALRFLTGVAAPAPFELPDVPISGPSKPLVDELVYLSAARVHRPELRQVREGVRAREAQVDFAKARLYPNIGLGLSFGYSNAPVVATQTNPFVSDPANYLRYGAGVVFQWNLDFLPGSARVRYAEWQLAETRDLEQWALGAVGVDVTNAYSAARDAKLREDAFGEAETLAKRWVSTVSAGMSVGTREEREIIDPLRAYLTNRIAHLQAVMDLDIAYSQLAVSTGDESFAEY